jgi:hypothetical protein
MYGFGHVNLSEPFSVSPLLSLPPSTHTKPQHASRDDAAIPRRRPPPPRLRPPAGAAAITIGSVLLPTGPTAATLPPPPTASSRPAQEHRQQHPEQQRQRRCRPPSPHRRSGIGSHWGRGAVVGGDGGQRLLLDAIFGAQGLSFTFRRKEGVRSGAWDVLWSGGSIDGRLADLFVFPLPSSRQGKGYHPENPWRVSVPARALAGVEVRVRPSSLCACCSAFVFTCMCFDGTLSTTLLFVVRKRKRKSQSIRNTHHDHDHPSQPPNPPMQGVHMKEPGVSLADALRAVEAVHDPSYVAEIKALSARGGGFIDHDTCAYM